MSDESINESAASATSPRTRRAFHPSGVSLLFPPPPPTIAPPKVELGVNIDHIATVRQARRTYEPDPVWAAAEAELGGADQITVHLREDRRHIQDRDVEILLRTVQTRVNLEMAVAPEIVTLALKLKPPCVCLV